MPYTTEEIKKQLDDAVIKLQVSADEAALEKEKQLESLIPNGTDPQQSENIEPPAAIIPNHADSAAPITNNTSPSATHPPNSASLAQKPSLTANSRSSINQSSNAQQKRIPKPPSQTSPARSTASSPSASSGNSRRSASTGVSQNRTSLNSDVSESASPQIYYDDDSDTGPENFSIKFDFDRAYRDVPEAKPLRIRRVKRTGLIDGLLYAIFVICISLVFASLGWLAATDVLGFGAVDEQVNITVPRGFSIEEIIDTLYESELIKYKFLFSLYASYSNAEQKISAGTYVLNKNYDYRAIVYGMTPQARMLVETTVTIPEGYTLAEIFARLEEQGVCYAEDLWEAAAFYNFNYSFLDESTLGDSHRLEGFLFPETYNFYLYSSPTQVISRFLNEFNNRFTTAHIDRANQLGYSIKEIITIASMIEKEAGNDDERPRIAAVMYNRLNNRNDFPRMQIDATIYYAISEIDIAFSTDYDNPYNTYLYPGLPPGPIANPGMESITAALYPSTTNEYYYALTFEGSHKFSRTLAEHEAFVASPEYAGNR